VVAVVLATLGVLHFGWHLGRMPWIAIGLAVTFGFYGLLRKVVAVGPLVGLTVETALMLPAALGLVWLLAVDQTAIFGSSTKLTLLFVGAGVVTTLPLLWFNNAAKLRPLSTLGFMQYLAPTLQLLCGVALYREPFTCREGLSFLLIRMAIPISSHRCYGPSRMSCQFRRWIRSSSVGYLWPSKPFAIHSLISVVMREVW
jgi:chloramphenicol-sensitive protein RarD